MTPLNFIQKGISLLSNMSISKKSKAEDLITSSGPYTIYDDNYTNRIKDTIYFYKNNGWVYSCVEVIGKSIAQLPIKVYLASDPDEEVKKGGPVDLLARPNPDHRKSAFIKSLSMSHELHGMSFIERALDKGTPELYNLKPYRFEIEAKRPSQRRYKYTVNGESVIYDNREIVFSRYEDPEDDYIGLSPLKPILKDLETWEAICLFNASFIANGGKIEGYFYTDNENITEESMKKLEKQWNQKHGGPKNVGKFKFFSHGIKYQQLSQSPKDMDYLTQIKHIRETLLAALSLPPVEVGIFEYANYANSLTQQKIFWENCILPRLELIKNALDDCLDKFWPNQYVVKFDLSGVKALQDDEHLQSQILTSYVSAGIITRDESREKLDLTPKGGSSDKQLVPMGLQDIETVGFNSDLTGDIDLGEIEPSENDTRQMDDVDEIIREFDAQAK